MSDEEELILRRQRVATLERQVLLAEKAYYQNSLAEFVKKAWEVLEPGRKLVWNWHLDVICAFLEAFRRRDFRNGIINIPYRLTKSTIVSVCYPAWVWCQEPGNSELGGPGHQFLTLSHKEPLALRDAVHTLTILESDWYRRTFQHVKLKSGQTEKSRYFLEGNGHRVSQGSKSGATGESADTILYDDPHDADRAQSDRERTTVTNGYDMKISSRLNNQSTGGKLIIMQRLHEGDLSGHVIDKEGLWSEDNPNGWVKLCLPMEFELDEEGKPPVNPAKLLGFKDRRTEPGQLIDEGRFPAVEVKVHKVRLGEYGTSGQFQQRPTPLGGGILRSKWWNIWPKERPLPQCDHVFLSWDTAYSEKDLETASFSVRTSWGVFWDEPQQQWALFLCGAWWDRVPYPDLRKKAQDDTLELSPDAHLIEKKASGQSLIQDLKRAGVGGRRIRLRTYNPDRDKVARAYAASATFQAGLVYAPDRDWAYDVIDHCASFPFGVPPCSDITDTVTQAVVYLSRRWWVRHPDDVEDEPEVDNMDYDEDDEPITQRHGVYG